MLVSFSLRVSRASRSREPSARLLSALLKVFSPFRTFGGLLIALPSNWAGELISALRKEGVEAAGVLGAVEESAMPGIKVV